MQTRPPPQNDGPERSRLPAAVPRHFALRYSIPCLAVVAGGLLAVLIGRFIVVANYHPDFAVEWASHQVPNPYDVARLREAIGRFSELPKGSWPYPYPPTFLLLTSWQAVLPLKAAYLIWAGLSGAALAAASRHRAAPLVLLSPWVIFPLMAGQTSVILGALIFGSLTTGYGVLLGIAACVKPQLVVLTVIGLAFSKRWQMLAEMLATCITLALTSILLAPDWHAPLTLWTDWLASIPKTVTVSGTIHPHLDLPGWRLKGIALCAALFLIWSQRSRPLDEQTIVATGTSLLVMPHSLWYNSAIMVPALVAHFGRVGWKGIPAIVPLFFFPTSALIALATVSPQLNRILGLMTQRASFSSDGVIRN